MPLEPFSQVSSEAVKQGANDAAEKFDVSLGILVQLDDIGIEEQIGSAFLLQHRDRIYCITAAHCIHALKDGRAPILRCRGEHLELACAFRMTGAHVRDNLLDRMDLAIGLLPKATKNLLQTLSPIDTRKVDEFEPESGIYRYVAIGFPASKNKPSKLKINQRSEDVGMYCGPKAEPPNGPNANQYSKEVNCFLTYDQKQCFDKAGNQMNGFSMRGMSGGLILRIGDFSDLGVIAGTKKPSVAPVGLITEYLPSQRIIVGTRLDFLINDIDSLF